MLRVLVADDQPEFLALAKVLLNDEERMTVVGVAASGLEAISLIPQVTPDVVVLDVQMPGMDGFAVTQEIKRRHPDVRVLVVSATDNQQYAELARQYGAIRFLPKRELSAAVVAELVG